MRLGCRVSYTGASGDVPRFARKYRLEFALFADEDTVLETSAGGYSAPTRYVQPGGGTMLSTPAPGMTPELAELPGIGFGVKVPLLNHTGVTLSGLTLNGITVDTSGLENDPIHGTGSGSAVGRGDAVTGTAGGSAYPPYRVDEDVQTTIGGVTSYPADVVDADGFVLTTPVSQLRTWMPLSWPGWTGYNSVRSFNVDSVWAAAQAPPVPTDDLSVLCQMGPLEIGFDTWQPVSVLIAATLEIETGSDAPSQWVSSGAGLTVTESAGQTGISVSALGKQISRTLVSAYQARAALVSGYEDTRRQAGEDRFFWGVYPRLRLNLSASVAGSGRLVLSGYHWVVENDGHETGSTRQDNYEAGPEAWGPYTYSFEFGVSDVGQEILIDLLFPDEGGPVYPTWVTSMTLSGLPVGDFTLNAMHLVGERANLKCDFGRQVQREDYSALTLAVGGSFPYGYWGDTAQKDREVGPTGGWLRFVHPLIGAMTGIIQDTQWTLEQFWSQLGLLEGVTVTWSAAAHEAAVEDPQGNSLGELYAQCTLPMLPGQAVTPGSAYSPLCAVVVGSVLLCGGVEFSLRFRQALRGAVEVLVSLDTGGRSGAGKTVTINPGGYTAVTDADGFAVLEAVWNDAEDAEVTAA